MLYKPEQIVRLTTPTYYVGIVFADEEVIRANPIVRFMLGWKLDQVTDYCREHGWKAKVLP